MAFDPDAFLSDGGTATATASSGFDPDAFLAEDAATETIPSGRPDAAEEIARGQMRNRTQKVASVLKQAASLGALGPAGVLASQLVPKRVNLAPIGEFLTSGTGELAPPPPVADFVPPGTLTPIARTPEEAAEYAAADERIKATQEAQQASASNALMSPLVEFERPEGDDVATGIRRGAINLVEGLTSPLNVGLVGVTGAVSAPVRAGISLGFAGQMGSHVPELAERVGTASVEGTPAQVAEATTDLVGTAAMTALAGTHGLTGAAKAIGDAKTAILAPETAKAAETAVVRAEEIPPPLPVNEAVLLPETIKAPDATPELPRVEEAIRQEEPSSPAVTLPEPGGAAQPGAVGETILTPEPVVKKTKVKLKSRTKAEPAEDIVADPLALAEQMRRDREAQSVADIETPPEPAKISRDEIPRFASEDVRESVAKVLVDGMPESEAVGYSGTTKAKFAKAVADARTQIENNRAREAQRANAPSKPKMDDDLEALIQQVIAPYNEGPGAANRSELVRSPVTGTKNAVMQAEREARGEEALIRAEPVSNIKSLANARETLQRDPARAEKLVAELNDTNRDVRTISAADEAVLMVHKMDLMRERAVQEDIFADGNATLAERKVAEQRLNEIEQRLNDVDQATFASGSEWGRLGQLRQRLIREDYSLEAMERRARLEKGDALTPEETTKIKAQAERIAELEGELEKLKTGQKEKEQTGAADEAVTRLKTEAKKGGAKKATDLDAQDKATTEAMRERLKDGDTWDDLRGFVQRLALNFVRRGVNQREPLIDAVHGVLKGIDPTIDRSLSRDLISGYGDFKALDKDPAKAKLRELKGEMQQVGKIEDMQNKRAPRKTGVERRTPSDEERRLIKEVNELKKKGGFNITDPATQLKSAMDAIKTRLRNEIRDIDLAIATQERIPGKKSSIEYDAEATALKAERDAKRAEYDEMFPKEPLTEEQLIARTVKSLDRSIERLQADLKAGKLYGEQGRKLTSPEIEARRAQLEALRSERELLRDLDTARIEAAKEARLLAAIDAASKSTPKPKSGVPTADSQRVAELKAQLEAIREARAQSPEAYQRRLDAATEAVKKQIAELDRRLREGDTSPRGTQQPELRSNELDTLRAERDAMEAAYREMVNATKPKKTAEQIALQSFKTRTLRQMAELRERMARNDFEPRAKREIKLDPEAAKLKFEAEQIKEQYNKQLLEYRLNQRSLGRKLWDWTGEIVGVPRSLITSIDFSGFLNQGGAIVLSRPLQSMKALPDMLRATFSEKAAFAAAEKIALRPNAKNGLYEKAKLYLADTGKRDFRAVEEAYQSRWARKLPWVRGSERSYVTVLNRLRADTFDAMVETLGKKGSVTVDEAKAIAHYINVATGRGDVGHAAAFLSRVFFSPRFLASRFQLMAAEPLIRSGTLPVARVIATEYARMLTGVGVIMALGALAGGVIETDPRSADFAKIRFGNTRIDPLLGMAQNMTLFARVLSGSTKTRNGEVIDIRGAEAKYGTRKAWQTIADFFRGKLNPSFAAAVDAAQGEDVIGREWTPAMAAQRLLSPISISNIIEIMRQNDVPEGVTYSLISLLGGRIQAYNADEKQQPPR